MPTSLFISSLTCHSLSIADPYIQHMVEKHRILAFHICKKYVRKWCKLLVLYFNLQLLLHGAAERLYLYTLD